MPDATILSLCLPASMCEDAAAGRVNIVNRLAAAVAPAGWRLAIFGDTPADRAEADRRSGPAIVHMQEPTRPGMLNLRRAYHYPFWQIEATNDRARFDVALADFDPGGIDPEAARAFVGRWRKRLFDAARITTEQFVFMPLQGRLSEHRSFQSMSPLDMIEATLDAEPTLRVRATLHPKEVYSAEDRTALERLSNRFPRFTVESSGSDALLLACAYVVTQNSAMAMTGYFASKPAVLFGAVDFHHIAGVVTRQGTNTAFALAKDARPDYAAYLWWFYQLHTINGGAQTAEDQIRARLQRHGWAV